MSIQDELRELLRKAGLEFDEKYLRELNFVAPLQRASSCIHKPWGVGPAYRCVVRLALNPYMSSPVVSHGAASCVARRASTPIPLGEYYHVCGGCTGQYSTIEFNEGRKLRFICSPVVIRTCTTEIDVVAEESAWKTRESLLMRIKDPTDERSWEDFDHYYRPFIYNLVRSMKIQHHDAEEIVQTVLVKSWNKLPEFEYDRNKGRFRGWLCQVSGNAVRDFIRKRRGPESKIAHVYDSESMLESSSLPEIEKKAEREWRRYLSEIAWKNIEKKFKPHVARVFLMAVEGIAPDTIVEELGIAKSSVYVYKSRVQKELRAEIVRLNRILE